MTVVWRYYDPSGASCGTSREFVDREEAEDWLGESWPKLVGSGIRRVELVEDQDVAYGMDLSEG